MPWRPNFAARDRKLECHNLHIAIPRGYLATLVCHGSYPKSPGILRPPPATTQPVPQIKSARKQTTPPPQRLPPTAASAPYNPIIARVPRPSITITPSIFDTITIACFTIFFFVFIFFSLSLCFFQYLIAFFTIFLRVFIFFSAFWPCAIKKNTILFFGATTIFFGVLNGLRYQKNHYRGLRYHKNHYRVREAS